MANITYLGKNGGSSAEFEAQKAEALRMQNEINQLKLERLKGTLVEINKVQKLIANSLTILRSRLVELPRQMIAQIRGVEHAQVHAIRMRLEQTVRRCLCECIVTLEKAPDPEEAIKALMADDGSDDDDRMEIIRRELRHEAVNAKRRAKRTSEKTS